MPEGAREWGSTQCSSLEHLEDFVRQFIGHAPTHMFVQTLLVLEAADARAAARSSNAGESAGGLSGLPCRFVQSLGYPMLYVSGPGSQTSRCGHSQSMGGWANQQWW